jgi:hypothetical protein
MRDFGKICFDRASHIVTYKIVDTLYFMSKLDRNAQLHLHWIAVAFSQLEPQRLGCLHRRHFQFRMSRLPNFSVNNMGYRDILTHDLRNFSLDGSSRIQSASSSD